MRETVPEPIEHLIARLRALPPTPHREAKIEALEQAAAIMRKTIEPMLDDERELGLARLRIKELEGKVERQRAMLAALQKRRAPLITVEHDVGLSSADRETLRKHFEGLSK